MLIAFSLFGHTFDCTPTQAYRAATMGLALLPFGLLLGLIIGAYKTRFAIKGKQSLYERHKKDLSKYLTR